MVVVQFLGNSYSSVRSRSRNFLTLDLDDELDHVTIQNVLRQTIMDQSTITEASGYRPPPSIPHYVKHHAKSLSHRPTFAAHFQTSAQKLIDGQALGIEDLIDVLTLKDNDGESARDSAVALDRLSRDQVSRNQWTFKLTNRLCLRDENRLHF